MLTCSNTASRTLAGSRATPAWRRAQLWRAERLCLTRPRQESGIKGSWCCFANEPGIMYGAFSYFGSVAAREAEHVPETPLVSRCPSKPTEEWERITIIALWIEGESSSSIARRIGVSPSTVNRWIRRVGMFMMMPYSAPDTRPFRVASWDSRKGLVLLSPLPLFPEKYKKLVVTQTLMSFTFFKIIDQENTRRAAVVQWNHACFGVRNVSKRTGSNPVHGLSVALVCSQLFCLTLLSLDLHRFSHGPELLLAIQVIPHHTMRWEADSSVPEGRQLVVKGALDNIARYFSRALNFTYTLASGRSFGTKLPNGSWSGMMGLVAREEVDLGAAPIAISQTRAEAVDFTMPLWTGRVRIVSGRGELETDPWGFLLPLTPLVWSATLISLAVVCAALLLPSSFLPGRVMSRADFRSVRVLLQQDVDWPAQWWWWERLVLGLWMLTTLVLIKSYSGNLMSLLAVKYLPQPFQSLQDVIDHRSVSIIWQKSSLFEQYIRTAKSGVFHEMARLEKEGRMVFHKQPQFPWSLDTFVRRGRHVLADADITITNLIARDYSATGRCDFYLSRDGFFPYSSSLISHKTDPLIQSIDKW
ncbi:Glutamate receptor 2 [Portunus trituberculatus]|uniref:Glutamate receptor 2 n=1 Tax=Portunus trituberculatus TaxID=210409 RepID=A0A5B7E5J9_PORTR|nr:Glutamate receptor 2 [Portunus trituberculatus]